MKKLSDSSAGISPLTFSEDWTRILSEYMGVCEAFIRRQVRKVSYLQQCLDLVRITLSYHSAGRQRRSILLRTLTYDLSDRSFVSYGMECLATLCMARVKCRIKRLWWKLWVVYTVDTRVMTLILAWLMKSCIWKIRVYLIAKSYAKNSPLPLYIRHFLLIHVKNSINYNSP